MAIIWLRLTFEVLTSIWSICFVLHFFVLSLISLHSVIRWACTLFVSFGNRSKYIKRTHKDIKETFISCLPVEMYTISCVRDLTLYIKLAEIVQWKEIQPKKKIGSDRIEMRIHLRERFNVKPQRKNGESESVKTEEKISHNIQIVGKLPISWKSWTNGFVFITLASVHHMES